MIKEQSQAKNNVSSSSYIRNDYIPSHIKSLLNKYKECNFALLFRYPNIIDERKKIKIKINDNLEDYKWKTDFLQKIKDRFKSSIISFKSIGFKTNSFFSQLSWRMVIGLGASHPQETSMTLHHIYGIPYIPGSAVKGATRHWVILSKFGNDEKRAENDIEFKDIFGTPEQTGKVIFFDAYPVDEIKLKIDVMTPHYEPYYSKGKPPADYYNPTPIKFLTVEKTKFEFYLASKSNNLLQKAELCLKDAIKNYGIGAKTAIGYGYFEL